MNYILFFIILGLCGAGYFEYTTFEQKNSANVDQITELAGKLDVLQAANDQLAADKVQMTKSLNEAKSQMADLNLQAQSDQGALAQAQSDLATAQRQLADARKAGQPAAATTSTISSNSLGTITTLNGSTFQNCLLLKVQAEGIVVNHASGISEILFGLMPPDLQKKFGYDPHQAATLTEAQVEAEEEQRKAAAQASAN